MSVSCVAEKMGGWIRGPRGGGGGLTCLVIIGKVIGYRGLGHRVLGGVVQCVYVREGHRVPRGGGSASV